MKAICFMAGTRSGGVRTSSTIETPRRFLHTPWKIFFLESLEGGDGRGFVIVKEDPAAEIERFSEEHGHMNVQRSERRYRVGDRLSVIPNHVCTTVNMHDEIYGVRGERVVEVWRVEARGKVR